MNEWEGRGIDDKTSKGVVPLIDIWLQFQLLFAHQLQCHHRFFLIASVKMQQGKKVHANNKEKVMGKPVCLLSSGALFLLLSVQHEGAFSLAFSL